jgi:hypothetical protein
MPILIPRSLMLRALRVTVEDKLHSDSIDEKGERSQKSASCLSHLLWPSNVLLRRRSEQISILTPAKHLVQCTTFGTRHDGRADYQWSACIPNSAVQS